MKSLSEILGHVSKGRVIVIYFGEGKSYVGQVTSIKDEYFGISPFGSTEKRKVSERKVFFNNPIFEGEEVTGYDEFTPGRGEPRLLPPIMRVLRYDNLSNFWENFRDSANA